MAASCGTGALQQLPRSRSPNNLYVTAHTACLGMLGRTDNIITEDTRKWHTLTCGHDTRHVKLCDNVMSTAN